MNYSTNILINGLLIGLNIVGFHIKPNNQAHFILSIFHLQHHFNFLTKTIWNFIPFQNCGCFRTAKMNALPFSIGAYTHNPSLGFGSRAGGKLRLIQSSALKSNESKFSSAISSPLTRREAVGFGFCFSILQLLHPRAEAAAAESGAAVAPCEFTAAPSGLAYCDKVVGTGPEPVKGQLIKVFLLPLLNDGVSISFEKT